MTEIIYIAPINISLKRLHDFYMAEYRKYKEYQYKT